MADTHEAGDLPSAPVPATFPQQSQQAYPEDYVLRPTTVSSEASSRNESRHGDVEVLNIGPAVLSASSSPSSPRKEPSEKLGSQHVHVQSLRPIVQDNQTLNNSFSQPLQVTWRPSLLRIGPLMGLAALLFAFLQILASYAVLAASDGDAVTNWEFQPTVYLAILTAVSNKALAFATIQGTVVTFWLRALGGTTLAQLHRDWGFGLYTYKAITAGRSFNVLALACIASTFVAIDGPLLQRASSVRLGVPNKPITLGIAITPEMPAYWSGVADYSFLPEVELQDFQIEFLPIYNEYGSQAPMKDAITGCSRSCTATVRAPALAVDRCVSSLRYQNFSHPMSPAQRKQFAAGCTIPVDSQSVFNVRFMVYNGTAETLNFTTEISDHTVAETCAGYVNTTWCSLVSAIGEYPVNINDGIITFAERPSYPKIIARANNTAITDDTIRQYGLRTRDSVSDDVKTTLSGVAMGANIAYFVKEGLMPQPGKGGLPALAPAPGLYPFQHITNYREMYGPDFDCAPAWKDPRDEIMASLNELLFRTGLYTAQKYDKSYLEPLIDAGQEIYYNVTGSPKTPVEIFHSDFRWFAGAAAVELFSIIVVLLTFFGYWRVGRHATMSPLEIAKAFDAPLLEGASSNDNGREIAKLEGSREVQYGVLLDETEARLNTDCRRSAKIVIAEKEKVHPLDGERRSLQEHYDLVMSHIPKSLHRHA